jgi:hypothetical protein
MMGKVISESGLGRQCFRAFRPSLLVGETPKEQESTRPQFKATRHNATCCLSNSQTLAPQIHNYQLILIQGGVLTSS